jgi:hypothetical protein
MALLIVCSSCVEAQQFQAKELLARALHLADLYNWADAAPAFAEAEQLFTRAGDQRNTLYARLGRIRSNIERDQGTLPMVSAQLAEALEDDPLLQNDKELRMFCFIVKGDIDTETNTGAMRQDWEQVQTLARDLGDMKWQYRALAQLGIAAFYDADLETARKNVGTALAAATKAGDAGAVDGDGRSSRTASYRLRCMNRRCRSLRTPSNSQAPRQTPGISLRRKKFVSKP